MPRHETGTESNSRGLGGVNVGCLSISLTAGVEALVGTQDSEVEGIVGVEVDLGLAVDTRRCASSPIAYLRSLPMDQATHGISSGLKR